MLPLVVSRRRFEMVSLAVALDPAKLEFTPSTR
jgi:hypothetical protein